MSQPKITVHWLECSRAQRVVWLLEELNVEYTLELYKRSDEKRAPEELKKLHPFGKSPLVEIEFPDGKKKVLAESGHIINYLINHFDSQGKFRPATEDDADRIEYYLHMAESTLQPPITMLAVMSVGDAKAPFMIRTVVHKYNHQVRIGYNYPEVVHVLDYLEEEIKRGGGQFFVGNKLSAADIMFVFPVAQICFGSKRLAECVDKKNYPALSKWSESITNTPCFKASIKKVEEQGKGKYAIHQDEL